MYPVNENEYNMELFEGELGDITEKIIVSDDTGEKFPIFLDENLIL